MNKPTPLEVRRAALIARCADERDDLALIVEDLREAPERIEAAGHLMVRLKLPLAILSALMGLKAARRAGPLPLLASVISLWKTAKPLLSMLRRPPNPTA